MPTWDDRIDEAARQLTVGQPRPGFNTRVLARLDATPRRWSRAWLLAPAAAIAIIAVVIVMPRENVGDVAVKPQGTEVEPATTEARLKPDPTPMANQVGMKADTTPADPTSAIAPSPPVEYAADVAVAPIEVEPLVVPRTVVDALAAPSPISVEEIEIAALDTLE